MTPLMFCYFGYTNNDSCYSYVYIHVLHLHRCPHMPREHSKCLNPVAFVVALCFSAVDRISHPAFRIVILKAAHGAPLVSSKFWKSACRAAFAILRWYLSRIDANLNSFEGTMVSSAACYGVGRRLSIVYGTHCPISTRRVK
jgi:hypothetical protein